jgi:hypothetical protein
MNEWLWIIDAMLLMEKMMCWEKNLFQFHVVQLKSHMGFSLG